ncbi:MAG: class II SORL domain-containing protein [Anaerolineae bacterium]
MATLGDKLQQADWKTEKHAPVIECPESVKAGEAFMVTASVGKEIPHPNTVEHHINQITLYFLVDGEKFPHLVGQFEFSAHGEAIAGANQGPVHTQPAVTASVTLNASGTFFAVSVCNIHGLWEGTKAVRVS